VDPETRFRVVFDVAYGPLCRYARHRGLDRPDAEDLVAQVLEIAWRRLDEVPADDPLPWLYAVAHNLWRNQARKDRRRLDLLARFSASLPSEAVSDSTDPGALRAALASLSDSDQEVLRLVAWDGLTPADLATVLGCTPVAARTRLHRARARLARKIGVDPDTGRQGGPAAAQLGVQPDARQHSAQEHSARQRSAPSRQKQGDSPDSVEMRR
jgi:RNA polymerase sigma-70 factor (ECF subfamily)